MHSLSTLRSVDYSTATQDSLPDDWPAFPGGTDYPQRPNERFQVFSILLSQASPGAPKFTVSKWADLQYRNQSSSGRAESFACGSAIGHENGVPVEPVPYVNEKDLTVPGGINKLKGRVHLNISRGSAAAAEASQGFSSVLKLLHQSD